MDLGAYESRLKGEAQDSRSPQRNGQRADWQSPARWHLWDRQEVGAGALAFVGRSSLNAFQRYSMPSVIN